MPSLTYDEINLLSGAELDCLVARAEGYVATVVRANGMSYCRIDVEEVGHQFFQPTENWTLAGRIAVRQRYTISSFDDYVADARRVIWFAEAQWNPKYHDLYKDVSLLVAICRLRVGEAVAAGMPAL